MRQWVALIVDREPECIERAKEFLQTLPKTATLLCGGERAADAEIVDFAVECGLKVMTYVPDREVDGAEAGVRRNHDMVDDADRLVVIHKGKGWGVQTTLRYAAEQRKKVEAIRV